MRILKNDPTELVIEEKPWVLGIFLALFVVAFAAAAIQAAASGAYGFAIFAALAAAGLWALSRHVVERVWLVFDRTAGSVEFRRRSLRGYRRTAFPLASLADVELQSMSGDGGRTYRLALRLRGAADPVAMTRYYQTGRGAADCVAAARAWLAAAGPAATGPGGARPKA